MPLPTASLTLADLFANPFLFSVPAYQRPFSWTVKEAGQLLDDIAQAAGLDDEDAAEPEYFLGTILLLDVDGGGTVVARDREPPRVFEIVDGQQRIVTLTILASCLRDLEQAARSDTRERLGALIAAPLPKARGAEAQFRVDLRGPAQSFFARHVQEPGATRRPGGAEAVRTEEKDIVAVRDLFMARLAGFSEAERQALAHYLCRLTHVVVILARDIDRAHRMFTVLNERGRPLQRNDILKAEVVRDMAPEELDTALRHWQSAADRLGPEFEHFFSHLRVIHGRLKPQVIAAVRSILKEVGGPRIFIEQVMTPLAAAYEQILRCRDPAFEMPHEIRQYLVYLSRLSGSDWVPAAMAALAKHADDPAMAARVLKEIDRLAHLWRLLCLGAGKRVRRFAELTEAIRTGQVLAPETAITTLTRDETRSIAFHLRDLHRRNAQVCKLLLLRLNDELAGGLTMLDPAEYSVEHILPQRPGATSVWRRWLPSGEERDACTESIGNLVVLSQKQNDRARNQDFLRKKEIYSTVENGHGPLPITRDVIEARVWRASEIKAREAKFLAYIASMWRIGGSGWGAKIPGTAAVRGDSGVSASGAGEE